MNDTPAGTAWALINAGFRTVADLRHEDRPRVPRLPGIGTMRMAALEDWLWRVYAACHRTAEANAARLAATDDRIAQLRDEITLLEDQISGPPPLQQRLRTLRPPVRLRVLGRPERTCERLVLTVSGGAVWGCDAGGVQRVMPTCADPGVVGPGRRRGAFGCCATPRTVRGSPVAARAVAEVRLVCTEARLPYRPARRWGLISALAGTASVPVLEDLMLGGPGGRCSARSEGLEPPTF